MLFFSDWKNADEFEGCIIRSRNEAVGAAMNALLKELKKIPGDKACSLVFGTRKEGA